MPCDQTTTSRELQIAFPSKIFPVTPFGTIYKQRWEFFLIFDNPLPPEFRSFFGKIEETIICF